MRKYRVAGLLPIAAFWGVAGGAATLAHLLIADKWFRQWSLELLLFVGTAAVGASVVAAAFARSWFKEEPASTFDWLIGWCLTGLLAGCGAAVGVFLAFSVEALLPLLDPSESDATRSSSQAGWLMMLFIGLPLGIILAATEGVALALLSFPLARTRLRRLAADSDSAGSREEGQL